MAKALPLTRSTPVDYLRRLEEKIDSLVAAKDADASLRAALAKLQAAGAPITTKEVALLLGFKAQSISNLSTRGQLTPRFGSGLYCSDDVRDFLAKRGKSNA